MRINLFYPFCINKADKFAVSYTYETGAPAQYGGNISGATWKHAGGTAQTYAYSYDTYGRLTSGTHSGGNGETIEYDANGNITSLTRTGARAETLTYTYTSGTNRLGTLKSNGSSKTFQYNADGTMKTDGLRTLALTYNYLKLPRTVKRGTTSTVTYIYDAAGNKLAVSQDGTAKNYYCGDFVYDGSLAVAYILTPNGQLTRDPSTGTYTSQYNIPDHLVNVRSVVSSSGTVLQSTDYYPFGLAFADADIASNRYLYNGKELEDYTLGTSYLGTLDYGARHYDPRIARWSVPDPMAEKYYGVNAYGYCAGNPVMLVDPNGKVFRKKTIGYTTYISATYWVSTYKEKQSAGQAVRIWNNRIDVYRDPEGNKHRIVYDLSVSYGHPKNGNIYSIVPKKSLSTAGETTGYYNLIKVREDYSLTNPQTQKVSSTGAHEIGHTLGMKHDDIGIMSKTQDEDRTNELTQQNLSEMLSSPAGFPEELNFLEKVKDTFLRLFKNRKEQ